MKPGEKNRWNQVKKQVKISDGQEYLGKSTPDLAWPQVTGLKETAAADTKYTK